MELNEVDLKDLHSSKFTGTVTDPGLRPLDKFRAKEFERESTLAEIFHENTKIDVPGEKAPLGGNSTPEFMNKDHLMYAIYSLPPEYYHHDEIDLPKPSNLDIPIGDVLERRKSLRNYTGDPISKQEIADLLNYGCGVNRRPERLVFERESGDTETVIKSYRTYPSAGGLYPIETYLFVRNGKSGIDEGLYHYHPPSHTLRKLRDGDEVSIAEFDNLWLKPSSGSADYQNASLAIILTGSMWRTNAKYGNRGYRLILENAGHICQNLHLVATALDLGSVPLASLVEQEAEDFIGINGVDESVVHTLLVGDFEGGDSDE